MFTLIGSILGFLGTGLSGFFGFKNNQILINALVAIEKANIENAETQARAQSIIMLSLYGSPAERIWRPVAMWAFLLVVLVTGFCANIYTMPGFLDHIYIWFGWGIIGYIPCISLDKMMHGRNVNQLVNTIVGSISSPTDDEPTDNE